jgi:hypothetical protein
MVVLRIDRTWWEHLSPKPMQSRRNEVDALLRRFCATEYGRLWISTVRRPGGAIRISPGQIIPTIHIVGVGDAPMFIVPMKTMREGHRAVASQTQYQGGPLPDGQLALQPVLMVDVVTDPAMIAAAKGMKEDLPAGAVKDPSLLFSAPARMLLAPTEYLKRSYVLYQHIFGGGGSYPSDGWFYVGVTTRSWQARWLEHRRAVESGSPLLFHRKLREELAAGGVTYIHHKVTAVTRDIEQLYNAEEFLVNGHWDDKRRLNMIPDGKSGLKYLRENGLLSERVVPMPDERDTIVETWIREHPRRGLPASSRP